MAIPPNDTPPDPTLPDWALEPGPGRQVERAGVSLAGPDFGENVAGTFEIDYIYPNAEEVDYFVSKGMNVFRFPFLWERMQRERWCLPRHRVHAMAPHQRLSRVFG